MRQYWIGGCFIFFLSSSLMAVTPVGESINRAWLSELVRQVVSLQVAVEVSYPDATQEDFQAKVIEPIEQEMYYLAHLDSIKTHYKTQNKGIMMLTFKGSRADDALASTQNRMSRMMWKLPLSVQQEGIGVYLYSPDSPALDANTKANEKAAKTVIDSQSMQLLNAPSTEHSPIRIRRG